MGRLRRRVEPIRSHGGGVPAVDMIVTEKLSREQPGRSAEQGDGEACEPQNRGRVRTLRVRVSGIVPLWNRLHLRSCVTFELSLSNKLAYRSSASTSLCSQSTAGKWSASPNADDKLVPDDAPARASTSWICLVDRSSLPFRRAAAPCATEGNAG